MIKSLRWPPPAARHVAAWAVASILLAPCSAWAGTIIPVDLPTTGAALTELILPTPIGVPILGGFNPLTYRFNEPRFLLLETGIRPSTLELEVTLFTTGQGQVVAPAAFRLLDADGLTTLSDETQFGGLGDEFVGSAQIIANVFDDRVFHAIQLDIDPRDLQGESDPGAVTGGTVTLSVTGFGRLRVRSDPSSGDYNQNGIVDVADYTVWRDTLGQTGTNLAADGRPNGIIDVNDYLLWKASFGETAGIGSVAEGSVPEPATLTLLVVGAVVLVAWRGRLG